MFTAASKNGLRVALAALVLAATRAGAAPPPDVQLVGTGVIPGNATDQSGLGGLLEDGITPRNQVGGFGSAISWTGVDDYYVGTPDRGPADGATTYEDRAYLLRIPVRRHSSGAFSVTPRLVATRLLRNERGEQLTGSVSAFDPTNSPGSLRFDPEGVRYASCGQRFYVSDEYGPFLYEFSSSGKRVRSIPLPTKLLIDLPSGIPNDELTKNAFGRQANRGMEGLAISPDGMKLFGIMQSPLIQDGGLDVLARVGTNVRIVEVDLTTGGFREFLYPLSHPRNGISEIAAVDDHRFLVLERDGRTGLNDGSQTFFKKLFLIDVQGASDIRSNKTLPVTGIPAGVTPVTKLELVDLVSFFAANTNVPEKFEGLAFGPDLKDGRHLLLVTVDNDFFADRDNLIYAFAITPSKLPGFEAQHFDDHCDARDHDDDDR